MEVKLQSSQLKRAKGFSLLELMVAVAVLGVILSYLFDTFTVYHRSSEVISQVTESQQNSRAIASLIERDIRHAGLMVELAGAFCGTDSTTAPDSLFVSDADAIDQLSTTDNDLGSTFPDTNVSSGSNTITVNLSLEDPDDFAYDTNGDGTLDSDFRVGGGVIIVDRGNPTRGTACGVITDVDLGSDEIEFNLVSDILASGPGVGEDLIAIPAHAYQVANASLMRNNMVLAMGVEDLQVAYFFDDNGNNTVDVGDYRGDGVGPNYDADSLNVEDAREIRVSFVTRTRNEDAKFPAGEFQAAENRAVVAGSDGFRRRVTTSTVKLRNFTIRE